MHDCTKAELVFTEDGFRVSRRPILFCLFGRFGVGLGFQFQILFIRIAFLAGFVGFVRGHAAFVSARGSFRFGFFATGLATFFGGESIRGDDSREA